MLYFFSLIFGSSVWICLFQRESRFWCRFIFSLFSSLFVAILRNGRLLDFPVIRETATNPKHIKMCVEICVYFFAVLGYSEEETIFALHTCFCSLYCIPSAIYTMKTVNQYSEVLVFALLGAYKHFDRFMTAPHTYTQYNEHLVTDNCYCRRRCCRRRMSVGWKTVSTILNGVSECELNCKFWKCFCMCENIVGLKRTKGRQRGKEIDC